MLTEEYYYPNRFTKKNKADQARTIANEQQQTKRGTDETDERTKRTPNERTQALLQN